MARKPGGTTISDVAKLAGVSPATVSKVMNNAPDVATLTRQRVMDAVGKLDFRPNNVARSLRVKHTRTLGLVTDDIEGVFTTSLARGVEEAASIAGFSVFLCNSFSEAARERAHLEVLLDKQVDGVILLSGYRVRERGAPALPLGQVPVVYLYQYTHDLPVPCVLPDDRGGAELGVNHLLGLGRRRIALINGPPRYEATSQRLDGYRHALEAAGVVFDASLVRAGSWHEDSGYRLARELMDHVRPPDALLCASDSIAAGALDALHQLGLDIPGDVAVVGFDDRPFAPYLRPPLTTVALPLYQMGKLAGDMVLALVRDGIPPVGPLIHHVQCSLIRRQSCGAER